MGNSDGGGATGSVFKITDELIKRIGEADDAFDKLVNNSQKRVSAMNKVFEDIANGSGMRALKEAFSFETPSLQKLTQSSGVIAGNFAKTANSVLDMTDRIDKASGSLAQIVQILNAVQHIDTGKLFGAGTLERAVDNWIQGGANIKNAIAARILGKQGDAQNIAEYEAMLKRLAEATQKAEERLRAVSQQATQTSRTTKQAAADLRAAKDATTNEREILEAKKQARIRKEQEIEDKRLAKAEEKLATAILSVAAAREKALAAEERLQKKAVIREHSKDFNSAMTYASTPGNTDTYNKRALAIKVLQEAIKNLTDDERKNGDAHEKLKQKIQELNKAQQETLGNTRRHTEEIARSYGQIFNLGDQLGRKIALIFSISSMKGYVEKLAEVRGEFELQQRSLQAILQDKPKADQIFNKTVQLAVRSPFRIKDLVAYTKQLASFRIESGKLYDTTKRLADVSAGLGVDMQRLILAYGQIKAASFLKGTEVRQLSEAGINVYGELQKYYEDVQDKSYSIAQIVDMISKRKVTFEDVEQVFKRLTDQGGLFFNMQEIQAETLQGKISNLKDSYDILLNEIGKSTEPLLKGVIDGTSWLLKHWKILATVATAIGGVWVSSLIKSIAGAKAFKAILDGISLKGGLWGAAIGLAVTGAIALYNKLSEAGAKLKEINKEYASSVYNIGTLSSRAKELATLSVKAEDNEKIDKKAIFTEQKQILSQLKEEMKKANITIPVTMEHVNESNIAKTIEDAKDKLKKHIDVVDFLMRTSARTGEGLSKSLDSKVEDFTNESDKMLGLNAKVTEAIEALYSSGNKLSEAHKKQLEELKKGATETESQIDFVVRAMKTLHHVNMKSGYLYDRDNKPISANYIIPLYDVKNEWDKSRKDIEKGWDSLLSSINSAYPNIVRGMKSANKDVADDAKEQFKSIITDFAVRSNWSGVAEDSFKRFSVKWAEKMGVKGLSFKFSEDDLAREVTWVDQWIKDYFKDKEYKVKLSFGEISLTQDDIDKGVEIAKQWNQAASKAKQDAETMKKFTDGLVAGAREAKQSSVKLTKEMREAFKNDLPFNLLYPNKEDDAVISVADLTKISNKYQTILDKQAAILGNPRKDKDAERREKDIWEARIDVMKKMQARYDSIRKYLDEKTASERTKEFFKEAALSTGLSEKFIKDMNLSNGGIVKAIDGLIKKPPSKATAKDIEKLKAWKAEVEMKIDEEKLKDELDKAKKEIDKAFDGYSLFTKMSDIGLHVTDIDKIFPGLPRTLRDVEKQIQKSFSIPSEIFAIKDDKERDKKLEEILGKDKLKQFQDDIARLRKQEVDHSRQTVEQLVKDYKNALVGQLEIDQWYARERIKIYENIKDPTMQQQMRNNLDKKKSQKDSELAWNQFKDSDYYVKIFENLEHVSTRVLSDMNDRLTGLRSSLNGLKPEQLKQIVQEQQKIQDAIIDKHPFQGITKDLVDYIKFLKERKKLETSLIESLNEEARLRNQQRDISSQITALKEEVDLKAKNNELSQEDEMILNSKIAFLSISLTHIGELLTKQSGITQNFQKKISEGEKASERLAKKLEKSKDAISGVGKRAQEFAAIWSQDVANSIAKAAEAFDDITDGVIQLLRTVPNLFDSTAKVATKVTDEIGQTTKDVTKDVVGAIENTTESAADGVKASSEVAATSIKGVEKASVILAIISAALQVATAIAKLLSDESDIDDQMAANERSIKSLQRAYDGLTESINNAWRAQDLNNYTSDAIEKQEKMIEMYRRQIALENDRKNPDEDKIQEYYDKIEDAEKAIKEKIASIKEELGALGSEANYKSAAQEFTDAWVDAFAEGEDALDAMNGKFNDMMKNFVKKQAMQRLVKAYLEPLFLKLDAAATDAEGKLRSPEDMLAGVTAVMEEYKDASGPLNEALKKLMEYFKQAGLDVQNLNNEGLSALQQGIQGITENTAEALESLLNSMRFALFEQKNDVAEMRRMLSEHFNGSSSDSPILSELKNLVSIQTSIRRTIESVVSPSGGKMMLMVKGIS